MGSKASRYSRMYLALASDGAEAGRSETRVQNGLCLKRFSAIASSEQLIIAGSTSAVLGSAGGPTYNWGIGYFGLYIFLLRTPDYSRIHPAERGPTYRTEDW